MTDLLTDLRPLATRAILDPMPTPMVKPIIECLRAEIMACRPGDLAAAERLVNIACTMGGLIAVKDEPEPSAEDVFDSYLTGMAAVMQALGIDQVSMPSDPEKMFASSFRFETTTEAGSDTVQYRLVLDPPQVN